MTELGDLVVESPPGAPRSGRKVIAVVGIDRYQDPNVRPLQNAVSDAEAVRSLFGQLGFEEEVDPLFNEAATGHAIESLVQDDLRTLSQDDQLVLFYAGHGATDTKQLGDHKIVDGYLLPFDATSKVATRIKLEKWIQDVSELPARHILVILDACFAGSALNRVIRGGRDVGPTLQAPLDVLCTRRSRQIITSTLDDQIAADSGPDREHSLFTDCLLRGLAEGRVSNHRHHGHRVTTGLDIAHYLRDSMRRLPDAERYGPLQTPSFGWFDWDERGEMLIPLLGEPGEDTATRITCSLADRHRELVRSSQLASPRARSLLAGRHGQFPAIDDAIVLSDIPRSSEPGEPVITLVNGSITEPGGRRWTRAELENTLDGRVWNAQVIAHLRGQLPDDLDKDVSGMKLGLVRIVRAAPNHDQPLTLDLEAWPWWVEREFNRRLLRAAPNSPDDHLAYSLANRLLTDDNDAGSYELAFPSGFYIELAVVDTDANVLILGKAARSGSHMAGAGMKWTCSIEEGVKLSDLSNGRLDPRHVALRGLREELGIAEQDVDHIDFGMVALQSRHLNTALLGVATVNEPCERLARRAAEGEFHDFNNAQVVALRSAYELFDGASGRLTEGTWHATARLRLHLAMVLHGLA